MSNGAVLSPQSNHADNNNDAKKVRTKEHVHIFQVENVVHGECVCCFSVGRLSRFNEFLPGCPVLKLSD